MDKKKTIEEKLAEIDWEEVKQRDIDGKTILLQRTAHPDDTPEVTMAIQDKLNEIIGKTPKPVKKQKWW